MRKQNRAITLSFWPRGDDLPLFSGVPITVAPPMPMLPELPDIPPSLFQPKCNVCLDTGVVEGKRCWCATGVVLHHSEESADENPLDLGIR